MPATAKKPPKKIGVNETPRINLGAKQNRGLKTQFAICSVNNTGVNNLFERSTIKENLKGFTIISLLAIGLLAPRQSGQTSKCTAAGKEPG